MKHARDDYNRIQDPEGLIPADEPVFLIRGQDKIGGLVVKIWADLARLVGAKDDICDKARVQGLLMDNWKKKKVPDLKRRRRLDTGRRL